MPPAQSQQQALHDVLRELASLKTGMEGLDRNMTSAAADAREARDTALAVKATIDGQNIPERLGGLKTQMATDKAEVKKDVADLRGDVVNAIDRQKADQKVFNDAITGDFEALSKRVETLETYRAKALGIADFFSWVARVAPWLLAIGGAAAAGLGWKDRIGG